MNLLLVTMMVMNQAPQATTKPTTTETTMQPNKTAETAPKSWVKPPLDELKKQLTPEQFKVTQQCGTDLAFRNQYWNNHEAGIYVDVVSGEPLFSSLDKYDSGSGWPSFTKPLEQNLTTRKDYALFYERTEIRSKHADSHLGHVFPDGPRETGGLRFCVNSSALRFVPVNRLEAEGYGQYLKLFETAKKQ